VQIDYRLVLKDHRLVLDVVTTLGELGDDRAVPPLAAVMTVRRWLARGKTAALKRAAVQALARIATPKATAALSEAGQRGDRQVRKIVRQFGCARESG
jgi:HEAT repeat protein